MQFFAGISRNTLSKTYMLLLTEFVSEFRSNALWDSYKHTLLDEVFDTIAQSFLYDAKYCSSRDIN